MSGPLDGGLDAELSKAWREAASVNESKMPKMQSVQMVMLKRHMLFIHYMSVVFYTVTVTVIFLTGFQIGGFYLEPSVLIAMVLGSAGSGALRFMGKLNSKD